MTSASSHRVLTRRGAHCESSSILDIDLDYFNLVGDPANALSDLLTWADHPVDVIAETHADAVRYWVKLVDARRLPVPMHILHIDEHHDMMNQRNTINAANVMYHAMQRWVKCRVYWMAEGSVDTPAMWLDPEVWSKLKRRFRMGTRYPKKWPAPQFVSITISADFLRPGLKDILMKEIMNRQKKWSNHEIQRKATILHQAPYLNIPA